LDPQIAQITQMMRMGWSFIGRVTPLVRPVAHSATA